MSLEIHRDIYSGMVAEELNKEGFFGQEYQLFGFLWADENQLKLEYATKEETCAEKFLEKQQQGKSLSPYLLISRRSYDIGDKQFQEQLLGELRDKLNTLYGKSLKLEMSILEAEDKMLANKVAEYFAQQTKEQLQEKMLPLMMILAQLRRRKVISQEFFEQFKDKFVLLLHNELTEKQKNVYGFMYNYENSWQIYTNAYWPAVVKKWFEYLEKGAAVSSLLRKTYLLTQQWYQIKADFTDYLKGIFDPELLQLCLEAKFTLPLKDD